MKTKRLAAGILTAAMVLTLAGCGNGLSSSSPGSEPSSVSGSAEGAKPQQNFNPEGFPIVNEPITVTLMGSKAAIQGEWSEMYFFKTMEEKTGISFEFDTPPAEVLEEKKNLALNGGTYPEVLFAASLSREQQVKYGSQGILIPLEDYIDRYCPNLLKCFEENPGLRESVTTPDGHIYAAPQVMTLPIAVTNTMWVNKAWTEKLNIADDELPVTTDGFYEMLLRFRDEDPNGNGEKDEIPFILFEDADKGSALYKQMMPWFGVLSPEFYVDDAGKIQYGMLHENAKISFEYMNRLFTEKLIDNDLFTQSSADSMAKGSEGKVGAGFNALPRFVFGNMSIEEEATYPGMGALSSPVNPTRTTTKSTGMTQGTFALTDKCLEAGNVEAMMRWLDYLYSEEGTILIHYGPEGKIWEHPNGDKSLYKWIPQADGRNTEEVRGGELTPDCGSGCPNYFKDEYYNMDDVQEQARAKWCQTNVWPFAKLPLPEMYFTDDEQKQLDILATDLKKYRLENSAKFITGDASFDEWNTFTDGLKKMGVEEMVAIYQTAYDRWAASGK